uniref:TolC family protein n=1 Tax=Selenomonas sp. TaxID=2053611 RepID=UPI0025D94EE0
NKLGIQIPLYTGGKIEGNIKRYGYELNAADLQVEGAKQSIRYKVRSAYYDVLQKKNLLRVAQSAVAMVNEELHLMQVQFEEGTVARSDVIKMQVQLADYQQDQLSAVSNLQVAKSALRTAIGLEEHVDFELADGLIYEAYDKDLQDCLNYAYANRPDVLAAAYKIRAAEAATDAEKAGNRPAIAGVANRSIVGEDPFKQERNSNWQYGVQMTWSIFDNQITAARVNAAKAGIRQQKAAAYEIEKNIRLQTESAYAKMRAAEERIQVAKAAIGLAEKNYELARVRYTEGVDILVNVTDAQEKFTQAQTKYITALYDYNMNKAGLEQAIGVPVEISSPRYAESVRAGKSSRQAMEEARLN